MKRQIVKTVPRTCRDVERYVFLPGHSYMASIRRMREYTEGCVPEWIKEVSGIVFTVESETISPRVRGYLLGDAWCVEIVKDTKTKRG